LILRRASDPADGSLTSPYSLWFSLFWKLPQISPQFINSSWNITRLKVSPPRCNGVLKLQAVSSVIIKRPDSV